MKRFSISMVAALLLLFGTALALDSNEEISIAAALTMTTDAATDVAEREQAQEADAPDEAPGETENPAEDAVDATADYVSPDTAEAEDGFTTFINLLESSGMLETLNSQGPYTLFAPTNSAFEDLDEGQLAMLESDPEMLQRILGLHVVEGAYTVEELDDAGTVQALNGETLNIHLEADGLEVNDASFAATDVNNLYANGVIHVMDEVILPEAVAGDQPATRGQEQTGQEDADIDVDVDQPGDEDAGATDDTDTTDTPDTDPDTETPEGEGSDGVQ